MCRLRTICSVGGGEVVKVACSAGGASFTHKSGAARVKVGWLSNCTAGLDSVGKLPDQVHGVYPECPTQV